MGNSKRILIVDDEKIMLKMLRLELEHKDCVSFHLNLFQG